MNTKATTEFFICKDSPSGESYHKIPVDQSVQDALKEMLTRTKNELDFTKGNFEKFEPAQKYSPKERLGISLSDPHVSKVKALYELKNINASTSINLNDAAYYFAIFTDQHGTKTLGVRRSTQFKGIVTAQDRLVRWANNTLQLVTDKIFKLDLEFDYIATKDEIIILRPTGFEFTAGIEEKVKECALKYSEEVAKEMPCVNFSKLKTYIQNHPKAARLIASIRIQEGINRISDKQLESACKANDIKYTKKNNQIEPAGGMELAFLELLDRRRYTVELIDGETERYVAANRKGIIKK